MNKIIYLVRHGEVDRGKEKRYIGRTELVLNHAGIRQSNKLKNYFSQVNIEKAFISPLQRSVQTAEIILNDKNIEMITMDSLIEINMGDWENLLMSSIRSNYYKQYVDRGRNLDVFIPPNGESFQQVQIRAMNAFEKIIRNTAGNVLIMAHAGVNRAILSKILRLPLKEALNIRQPYGCINQLHLDKATQHWVCKMINLKDELYEKRK